MLRRGACFVVAMAVSGCMSAEDHSGATEGDAPSSASTTSASTDVCDSLSAGDGWKTDWVDQQYTDTAEFGFLASPSEPSGHPVDAVIGLANGPASHFTDLGPIVRFNPAGYVDVRNGNTYSASAVYAYTPGHQYLVEMKLNFSTHRYSVQIGEYPNGAFINLANDFAFRSEQATMPRIDNYARIVDSSTGSLRICIPGGSLNAHVSNAGDPWSVTPMRSESGPIHVQFETGQLLPYQNIDAVFGLAQSSPGRFTDLAAIVRFSAAGTVDARDGGSYRADATVSYVGKDLFVNIDANAQTHTYSASVVDEANGTETVIAHDYAFRTEQKGATSLGFMGRYIDSSAGSVYSQRFRETY